MPRSMPPPHQQLVRQFGPPHVQNLPIALATELRPLSVYGLLSLGNLRLLAPIGHKISHLGAEDFFVEDVRAFFAAEGFEGFLEVEGPDSLPDDGEGHVVFVNLGFEGWMQEGKGFDLRFAGIEKLGVHELVFW